METVTIALRTIKRFTRLSLLDAQAKAIVIVCPGASPSAGGEWPVGEGRKAPLVASDSSSSGGSDSEEDDKTAAAVTETTSSGANKKAEVKRLV